MVVWLPTLGSDTPLRLKATRSRQNISFRTAAGTLKDFVDIDENVKEVCGIDVQNNWDINVGKLLKSSNANTERVNNDKKKISQLNTVVDY